MTPITNIQLNANTLAITWQDGIQGEYDYLWLRDNCPSAFHPDTHERNFDLLSISEKIKPISHQIKNNTLHIIWSEHTHHSQFDLDWLKHKSSDYRADFLMMPDTLTWQGTPSLSEFNYQAVVQDNDALYQWLNELARYGISVINKMPSTQSAAQHVAERIGHLRRTNFGLCFDVQSKPNPNNQAYTAEHLPLHTDLPNQETPPGYQFLHCLENSTQGGESIFVDGFKAAQLLKASYPDDFTLLSTHKIPFRFHDDDCDIREMRPVISLVDNEVNEIIFNAHIADTFNLPINIMRPYYLAYRRFITLLNDETLLFRLRLNAAQMVVFDNRRVLHGRGAFDPNSGRRHLRGCYVDRTEFKSRLRMLQTQRALTPTPV